MLVLTRKIQQQIQIGPNVTITILNVKGQAVSVGIQAPRDVRIIRGELIQPAAEPEVHDIFVTRDSRAQVRETLAQRLTQKRFSLPEPRRDRFDERPSGDPLGACAARSPLAGFVAERKG